MTNTFVNWRKHDDDDDEDDPAQNCKLASDLTAGCCLLEHGRAWGPRFHLLLSLSLHSWPHWDTTTTPPRFCVASCSLQFCPKSLGNLRSEYCHIIVGCPSCGILTIGLLLYNIVTGECWTGLYNVQVASIVMYQPDQLKFSQLSPPTCNIHCLCSTVFLNLQISL